jgi:hypothetical protein
MCRRFGLQFLPWKRNHYPVHKFLNGRNAASNFPLISELSFEILNNLSPSGCFSLLQKWSIDINKSNLFLDIISWKLENTKICLLTSIQKLKGFGFLPSAY